MVRFNTGDEQSSSRFFTKLNADVRREIFIHLYGSRHVHVIYEEGIALLYNTNTLLFEQSIDVVNFNTIAIDHMRFIRSLELHITLGQQDSWGKETDAFRLAVSTLRDWDTWHRCKPVKICVFGELDDAPPKRQKQKVRRDAQREFTRAVRALVENVDVQVYLNDKDDKEIIQPRLLRDIPGLTFADSSEHFPDRRREEDRDVDSDFEGSFHMAVERVFRAGG
ncbi:hypothetical protein N0V84_010425 [Fusarium piperis]|uniref:Uncharacterized protein n=1 Tax=Fusarium piperis TaxID=1435070 RepID=A0A9W8W3T2_9HYPO|nr:hypothetical protein N0V84_010425 [Fusarium piperis]